MPSMSPNVNAYGQVPPEEQVDQLFKDRFTRVAYNVLYAKFSELAPNIVTFKILECDANAGRALGAFILLYSDKPIYIPVFMTDGQLKPLDLFYFKELNMFLPLSVKWLDEISKMSLTEMGHGEKMPHDVPSDVNIRDIILPPITPSGRLGFASDQSQAVNGMFEEAECPAVGVHPQFLEFVEKKASLNVLDGIKLAFDRHPNLVQSFARNYGTTKLAAAFRSGYARVSELTKSAQVSTGDLHVFTKDTPVEAIKSACGNKTADVFSDVVNKGYAIYDTRLRADKIAVRIEHRVVLQEPGSTGGWYRLYFVDGPTDIYYVVPFPERLCTRDYYDVPYERNKHRSTSEYLVIKQDAKEAWKCDELAGEKIVDDDEVKKSPLYKILFGDSKGESPVQYDYGIYVVNTGREIQATCPMHVERKTDEGTTSRLLVDHTDQVVQDDDPSRRRIQRVPSAHITFVPKHAKWITLFSTKSKSEDKRDWMDWRDRQAIKKTSLIHDNRLLYRWLNGKLQESGGRQVNVKRASSNEWWIDDSLDMLPFGAALKKVATTYGVSAKDAEGILKDAAEHERSQAFILTKTAAKKFYTGLTKVAQPPMGQAQGTQGAQGQSDPSMAQGMPPQGGMPPGGMQGQMDPSMMQGGMPGMMPPPTMSPTDLAIGEMIQQLSHQMETQSAAMQGQQQATQQMVQMLQQIQQRSGDLAQATGGTIPMGAEQSPEAAAQMIAPPPPPEEQPPMMPMMSEEPISAEMVANQINPEMMEQADELHDQGVFDTTAMSMLGASSGLQDLVSTYIPNMERCLDSLGRVIVTFWRKEKETRESIGDEQFIEIEDKLRTVFRNLGETVLSISHNATSGQDDITRIQLMNDQR